MSHRKREKENDIEHRSLPSVGVKCRHNKKINCALPQRALSSIDVLDHLLILYSFCFCF